MRRGARWLGAEGRSGSALALALRPDEDLLPVERRRLTLALTQRLAEDGGHGLHLRDGAQHRLRPGEAPRAHVRPQHQPGQPLAGHDPQDDIAGAGASPAELGRLDHPERDVYRDRKRHADPEHDPPGGDRVDGGPRHPPADAAEQSHRDRSEREWGHSGAGRVEKAAGTGPGHHRVARPVHGKRDEPGHHPVHAQRAPREPPRQRPALRKQPLVTRQRTGQAGQRLGVVLGNHSSGSERADVA